MPEDDMARYARRRDTETIGTRRDASRWRLSVFSPPLRLRALLRSLPETHLQESGALVSVRECASSIPESESVGSDSEVVVFRLAVSGKKKGGDLSENVFVGDIQREDGSLGQS